MNDLVYQAETAKRARLEGDDQPWDPKDEESGAEYWRYYAKAKEVLNRVPGYKFEITPTVVDGFRWLKVLTSPANGLKDATKGLTRYLTPVLTPQDYEVLQDFALDHCDNDMKFFGYMLPVVCLGEGDNRSKIRRGIAQELNMAASAKASVMLLHSTNLSELSPPPEEVVSFVPEYSQFPPALVNSGLTFYDFLYWFYGPSERESFALHVGRAATGPQGAQLAGESEPLQHSYRQAIIIKGNPLLGKALPNSEPVLTPGGWVENGTIKVGDKVIGSKGQAIDVLGVYPQGLKEIYNVHFSDNTTVRCSADHLWTVTDKRHHRSYTRTLTLEELRLERIKFPSRKHSIPKFPGLDVSSKAVSNAWALGYAYGNGCFSQNQFQISCHRKDFETVQKAYDAISSKPGNAYHASESSSRLTYGWAMLPEEFAELRAQGLNKRIPDFIKSASLETRREFFMGYFDADGSVSKTKANSFDCSNLNLFNDLVELARSNGDLVSVILSIDKRKPNHGNRGLIRFNSVSYSKIRNPRLPTTNQFTQTFIEDIELAGYSEESTCISVDAEDCLYVTANYKLTHNTWFNEFLVKGFQFCGLKTATIQDLNTRFGHGDWLSAAWSYADDTTRAMLNAFYNSSVLKTACSNGLVKSEQKGANSFDIKAMCAPVLLANDTDSRDTAKADSGNANRIRTLSTVLMETAKSHKWPSGSCLEDCPGALPANVIIFLCKKYNVEPELLSAYFIRLCVDYFRSFTLVDLLDKCNHLGETLYSRTNATSLQALANACTWASIALTPRPEDCGDWPSQNEYAVNSAEFIFKSLIDFSQFRCRKKGDPFYKMRVALYIDYIEQGKPATHPYKGFEAYAFSAVKATALAADTHSREMRGKGLEAVTPASVFTKVFQGLVDSQGVSSQYSLAILQEKWRDALYIGFSSLIATSERVRAILQREGCFDEVLGEVFSVPATAKAMEGNCMLFEQQFVGTDFQELTTVKYTNVLDIKRPQ